MKFLGFTTLVCILSFSLSGVFYSYADFDEVVKNTKLGKYGVDLIDISLREDEEIIEKEHIFKVQNVERIEMKISMADLTIKPSDSNDVVLKLKFISKKQYENFQIKNENNTLLVWEGENDKAKKLTSFFGSSKAVEVELFIPLGLVVDYELKLAFGELDVETVQMNAFVVKMAAGDIDFEAVKFRTGSIDLAAGDIDLEKIIATEGLSVKAAAGSVDIEMNQADPVVKIKAAAGDVDFSISEGIKPNLIFKNISSIGELDVRPDYKTESDSSFIYGEGKGMVDIKTTFGDVDFE